MTWYDIFIQFFSGHIYFGSFEDVVNSIIGWSSMSLICAFFLSCVFHCIYELINIGGNNGRNH